MHVHPPPPINFKQEITKIHATEIKRLRNIYCGHLKPSIHMCCMHYFAPVVARGFLNTKMTESPRRNIFEMNLSLFTGLA
jgi:hypothetical protein